MSAPCIVADWPAPRGVHAFTTLRHGAGRSRPPFDSFNLGNRHAADGDEPRTVEANRDELVARFGLPTAPRWLRQVHGTRVIDADTDAGAGGGDEPEADAAIATRGRGVVAILSADCLPVLLCSRDGAQVAGAHAGWRGLAAGVLEATVEAMATPPGELLAWLGPAAGPVNYEAGVEVYDAFVAQDWGSGAAFRCSRPDHWHVDLYALARRRLEAAGIPAGGIHGGGLCTIADPARFYSHRRDRRSGRLASIIWSDAAI